MKPLNHMNYLNKLLSTIAISVVISSCTNEIKTGDQLSVEELEHIKELGILDENEGIILFDSQSGNSEDVEQAGNFFTEKRLASYWLDEDDETKTTVNSAYFSQIDTIRFVDKSKSLFDGSYIIVETKDSVRFNVYVNGDSTQVWNFFEKANEKWLQWR